MPAVKPNQLPRIEIAGISALDLRDAQNAIRRAYGPRYHVNEQALWDVAALWGIAPEHERINPHGVFAPIDETIRVESGRSFAEIKLAQAPSGLWALATDYHLPNSGAGSAPSVWNHFAYFSRNDARSAGLGQLRERFATIGTRGGSDAKAAHEMMARIDEIAAEQMELFQECEQQSPKIKLSICNDDKLENYHPTNRP